jgi:hypothetical protein
MGVKEIKDLQNYEWEKAVDGTLKQVRALRIIRITAQGKI